MKKISKVTAACAMALATCITAGSCGGRPSDVNVSVDESKTQLYIWNYNGGYGTGWLYEAKTRFEEMQKDVSYESGKKGVELIVTGEKPGSAEKSANDIRNSKHEMYFTEGQDYYKLYLGDGNGDVIGDITDAITTPNQFDGGKTIASKLTDQQQDYYTINGKYYGIPHYQGNFGFIYNIDLFEQKDLFFRDGYETAETEDAMFVGRGNTVKSVGPDGTAGTYDDGLPVTYDDFYVLLKQIQKKRVYPIVWTGKYREQYIDLTFNAVAADVDGAAQHQLKYTMSGEATTLGTIQNGQFVKDAEPTVITGENAYELARQEGTYWATQMFAHIFNDAGNYDGLYATNTSDENTAAQYRFIKGEAAILMEGVWWEGESEQANNFSNLSKKRSECNFGIMPMPKPAGHEGERNTVVDTMDAVCFTKAGISEAKQKVANDFIKYVYSDEQLVQFTKVTNSLKAVNYTISEEDQKDLTTFGRNLYTYVKNSDVVYEYSTNPLYYNNASSLRGREYYKALIAGLDSNGALAPYAYLLDNGKNTVNDANEYFSAIYATWKGAWKDLNK
jgi:ABC-type glycerol-3-phosphate transport system substrate-binding protein